MANNKITYSIGFNIDSNKAKQQIKDLQKTLTEIGKMDIGLGDKITDDIAKAAEAARDLNAKIKTSLDPSIGLIDGTKLNASLKQNGKTIEQYATSLGKIGMVGHQAFTQLTSSILSTEASTIRVNKWMEKLGRTMANTIRWEITTTALNSITGAISKAYQYAEDLNESLTNIRIVTGQSSEQMARFAKEANKSAKALSTTTVEYTDAALIYYQQGLSDEQVKERTDVTVKMANVARESAETVSDQMTAVWNNFYDGSKSLEYYADVMTKLGAATASSTDEIAGGLEKFAAIADTVGLSFEYATAALATVTAQTRQSEDVVGTAFRTIFARIQGLQQGESQEDGVTLNKYSEALMSVGINIFDTNNNLKEMDIILDELGSKWQTMSEVQQMALAQTVAGTRQYAQLIALMDNWNDFQQNLDYAYNAEGELNQQAEIFAESWEAARDRVTASLENIYNKLLNDDAFIVMLNVIEKTVDGVGGLIDAVGGLGGVISSIGIIATTVFSKQIAKGIDNTVFNVNGILGINKQKSTAFKDSIFSAWNTMNNKQATKNLSKQEAKDILGYNQKVGEINKNFINLKDIYSKEDQEYLKERIDTLNELATAHDQLINDLIITQKKAKEISKMRLDKNVSENDQEEFKKLKKEEKKKIEQELIQIQAELNDNETSIMGTVEDISERSNTHAIPKLETFGDRLTEIGQAAAIATTTLAQFANIANIWSDEELSSGEKVLQTIQAIIPLTFTLISLKNTNTLTTLKEIAAQAGLIISTNGLTFSFAALNTTMKAVAANPMTWWIIGLTAAVAGLSVIFQEIKRLSPEGQLKEAEEETQKASEAAKKANTAYSDLLSTFEKIANINNTLKSLTEGTTEWKNAIRESNEEALKLIDTYNLVEGKDYSYDSNGVIHFTKTGENTVKQEAEQAAEFANNRYRAAQINERQKRINIYDQAISGNYLDTVVVEQNGGQQTDYVQKTVSFDPKTLVDAFETSGKSFSKAADLESYFKEQGIYTEQQISGLVNAALSKDNQEQIKTLAEALRSDGSENIAVSLREQLVNSENFRKLDTLEQKTAVDVMGLKFEEVFQKFQATEREITDADRNQAALAEGLKYRDGKYYNANNEEVKDFITDKTIKNTLDFKDAINQLADTFETGALNAEIQAKANYSLDKLNNVDNVIEDQRATLIQTSLELDAAVLEDYKQHLIDTTELTEEQADMAERVATANMAFNKGLKEILDNLDDYKKALKYPGTEDFVKAISGLKENLGYMLDIDTSNFSDEFLSSTKVLNAFEKAANGDLEALDQLKIYAGTEFLVTIGLDETKQKEIENVAQNWFNANEHKLTYGMSLETADAQEQLTNLSKRMLTEYGMTTEEIQKYFNAIGWEPEFDYTEVDWSTVKNTKQTLYMPDDYGNYHKVENTSNFKDDTKVYIPTLNAKKTTFRGRAPQIASPTNKSSGGSKKPKKSAVDEKERYHVVKEQMEDVEEALDEIGKAQERAFGKDKLSLIDEEIEKTKDLLEVQKRYLSEIEGYYAKDKAAIMAYGAKFDENGVITNYDQLIEQQVAKYNKKRSEAAEEEFEKFKKVLEQYEETSDLLAEERQNLIDQENELYDLLLEKLEYKIELQLEIDDDDIKYLDFLLGQVGDSAYDAADAIALLGSKTSETISKINSYTEGLNGLFQNRSYEGNVSDLLLDPNLDVIALAQQYNLTDEEIQKFREYRDGIMSLTEELIELRQEIRDKVIPAFDDLTEAMDKEIDKLDHLTKLMGHYKNIIDIVGKDTLEITDELMKMLDTANVDNSINHLSSSYNKLQAMRAARAEAEAGLASAEDSETIKYWEETLAEIDEKIRAAEEEYMSSWENALQAAGDAFASAVERAIDRFEEAMSGTFGNFETLQDAYDKQQKIDERYLADYAQIYELNKLNRDISNSIDNTDNIKGKQLLIDLQKEINDLEAQGVELSQYDVDFLRKKYELRLAEIALEEAQNAKSQVRMTRDSEGNWSYTYTADQQNVADAQQKYEDVLYETQKLSTDYINNVQGQILEAQQNMLQELATLRADDEEGRKRVIEYWTGQIAYLTSQMDNGLKNNKEIYEEDWTRYSEATGYKISANEDFVDNFAETNLSILTGFKTLDEYYSAFSENTVSLLAEVGAAADTWQIDTERAMEAAGTSIKDYGQTVTEVVSGEDGIIEQSNAAAESTKTMADTMQAAFGDVVSAVMNFDKEYAAYINSIIDDNKVLIESCNNVIKAWANVEAAENRKKYETIEPTSGSVAASAAGSAGVAGKYGGTVPDDDTTTVSGGYRIIQYGGSSKGHQQVGGVYSSEAEAKKTLQSIMLDQYRDPSFKYKIQAFASGGYTGSWGTSQGRLAMLHEKELVLNKADTENILTSVEIVRGLTSWLETRAQSMGVTTLGASGLGSLDNSLNQNITIDANFPNATSKEEISAAFRDLFNTASQYANRKG